MAEPLTAQAWPARYKASQLEILEAERHHIWIASVEVRKVLPTFRSDSQLQKEHGANFQKRDKGPRNFLNESALTRELKRMRSKDALMFLAWMEKTIYYPATRKREGLPALPPMPSQSSAEGDGEEDQSLHIPTRKPPVPLKVDRIARRSGAVEATAQHGNAIFAPVFRHWRGTEGLFRTLLANGLATLGWTGAILFFIVKITDQSSYTGSYVLRQWLVLLLLVSMGAGFVWWCVGVMRCALRRQREGHSVRVSLLVFVGGLLMLLNLSAAAASLTNEWLQGWWDNITNQRPPTQVLHDPQLGRIVIQGEIGFGSLKALERAIQMKPKLTLIQIESPGGYVVEGMAMARLIEANRLDTVSLERCVSSCTFLLAAGEERYLGPQVKVGFHRSGVFGYSPSTSWADADYQLADYYKSRNTSEDFIKLALDTPFNKIWIPTHGQMFTAGYATKRWDERKAGY